MMHAASTSPASSALTASRSPPMWSPCLPTQHVVADHAFALDAGLRERDQRDQRRLRRVGGADAEPLAAQLGERLRSDQSARTSTTLVRSQSVSRIAIASAVRPRPRAARSASIHASGEFHATSMSPRRCASTWRS